MKKAKLATERLAKEQIKVAAANKKVIRQLEGFSLDSVSGQSSFQEMISEVKKEMKISMDFIK